MLRSCLVPNVAEAGCDEAGRGCLAGSVYAAAVIFPSDYQNEAINDSKQLTDQRRHELRQIIERDALAWAIGIVTAEEIDRINILNASILAMHRALDQLKVRPQSIIVDGNKFKPYHEQYPCYCWNQNKGYPTQAHRDAIRTHGPSPYHRMSYNLLPPVQLDLFDE